MANKDIAALPDGTQFTTTGDVFGMIYTRYTNGEVVARSQAKFAPNVTLYWTETEFGDTEEVVVVDG